MFFQPAKSLYFFATPNERIPPAKYPGATTTTRVDRKKRKRSAACAARCAAPRRADLRPLPYPLLPLAKQRWGSIAPTNIGRRSAMSVLTASAIARRTSSSWVFPIKSNCPVRSWTGTASHARGRRWPWAAKGQARGGRRKEAWDCEKADPVFSIFCKPSNWIH